MVEPCLSMMQYHNQGITRGSTLVQAENPKVGHTTPGSTPGGTRVYGCTGVWAHRQDRKSARTFVKTGVQLEMYMFPE